MFSFVVVFVHRSNIYSFTTKAFKDPLFVDQVQIDPNFVIYGSAITLVDGYYRPKFA